MQKSGKLKRNYSAVSGIIGEVLLTGIFVIAISSLALFLYSVDGPEEVHLITVEETVDPSSDTICLQHCGGESIDSKYLKVLVSINGNDYVYSPSEVSEKLGKDYWELADVIEIGADEEWGADITNEDDVVVKLIDLDSNAVLPKYRIDISPESNIYFRIDSSSGPGGVIYPEGTIYVASNSSETFFMSSNSGYKIFDVTVDSASVGPVSSYTFGDISSNHTIHAEFTPDFEIVNDTIVPKGSFISGFGVLGAAIQSGGDDLKVTARVKIGNDTFDPWGPYDQPVTGNVNDHTTYSWDLDEVYPAGTPITISGKSWIWDSEANHHSTDNDDWHTYLEFHSEDNPDNVIVLENGDDVPTIPGLDEQPDVAEFVDDYVEDGKIVLAENEAIFLFELGTTDLGSSAADFQDLVILVSVDSGED